MSDKKYPWNKGFFKRDNPAAGVYGGPENTPRRERGPIEVVYDGPEIMPPPDRPVYAGPVSDLGGAPAEDVYAGPEFFADDVRENAVSADTPEPSSDQTEREGLVFCPRCKSQNSVENKFCAGCGAKLVK